MIFWIRHVNKTRNNKQVNNKLRLKTIWKAVTRRKAMAGTEEVSDLPRVLGLTDLLALGIASTLGMGVYIMPGSIARIAGPASSLSFLIAGIAAALSALCYCEFAARVPKAGSAYVYSYVAVGEMTAFVVGWNVALEYVIGTACVARGLSNYIDAFIDYRIGNFLSESMPIDFPYLSSYPDFFSFFITVIFSGLLAFGVVISSNFNKIFTALNLFTISVVVLAGAYKANLNNWSISSGDIPDGKEGGSGGFMPFGFVGVLRGAAKCFFAYTGFDCVATTGEEAKNPQRNMPLALILTLLISFITYVGISASLTLMWPYYDQNVAAPFPYTFEKVNLKPVKFVVSIGALCALCACMVGSVYGTSRILYSMACDGLLFKSLSRVNKRLQTPLVAVSAMGLFTGVVSIFFDMEMLVDMTSIGTLMAYTIVSICVLLLRYENQNKDQIRKTNVIDSLTSTSEATDANLFKIVFNFKNFSNYEKVERTPTPSTCLIVKWMTFILLISTVSFCGCLTIGANLLVDLNPAILILLSASAVICLLSALSITRQPQSEDYLHFKVRFVPLIPLCSSLMNISLMMMLNFQTWIRFVVWMLLGFVVYFGYGVRHSAESKTARECQLSLSKDINNVGPNEL